MPPQVWGKSFVIPGNSFDRFEIIIQIVLRVSQKLKSVQKLVELFSQLKQKRRSREFFPEIFPYLMLKIIIKTNKNWKLSELKVLRRDWTIVYREETRNWSKNLTLLWMYAGGKFWHKIYEQVKIILISKPVGYKIKRPFSQ